MRPNEETSLKAFTTEDGSTRQGIGGARAYACGNKGSEDARVGAIERADGARYLHRPGSSRPYGETLTRRNRTSMYNAPRSECNVAYLKLDCCTLVGFLGLTSLYRRVFKATFYSMFKIQRGPCPDMQLLRVDTECTIRHGQE